MRRTRALVQGLLYPAFLGFFLISAVQNTAWTNELWSLLFGIFLFGYFVAQFLQISIATDPTYNTKRAAVDLFILALMVTLFHLTGISALIPVGLPAAPGQGWLIAASLSLTFLAPVGARLLELAPRDWKKDVLAVAGVIASLVLFGFFSWRAVAAVFLLSLLLLYFWILSFTSAEEAPRKVGASGESQSLGEIGE